MAGRTTGATSDHTRTNAALALAAARADNLNRNAGTTNSAINAGSSRVGTGALAASAGTANAVMSTARDDPASSSHRRARSVVVGGRSRMAPMMLKRLIRTLVNRMVAIAMISPIATPLTRLVGVTANEMARPDPSVDQLL